MSFFIQYLVLHRVKIRSLTNEQQNLAEATLAKLGSIPRICMDFVGDQSLLRAYEEHCQAMVMGLTEHSRQCFR
jgi:hypothetical protein